MSDTYGSGLGFGIGPDAPPPQVDAPMSLAPPTTMSAGPAPTAPQDPQQDGGPLEQFGGALKNVGGMLKSIIPGPNYTPADPQLSPLDQSADLLQQRVKRANQIATNPLLQLFAPEQVQAARDFAPKAAETLQKIEQQKSAIQSGRVQAQSLGLDPGEVSDQASQEDRFTIAQSKALKGDMRAFQGLSAVAPERAAAIAPQVHEVVAGHLEKAQLAFDSLAGMTNQGQYNAKLNQLRQDGTLTDLESLGMKLPPTFDAFNSSKAAEGLALRNARIGIDTIRQKLEERNTYQPMAKDEAVTYKGRLTTAYGDEVTNGTWGRNGASGARGFINNGMATAASLGKGGTLGNADQRKQLGEEMAQLVPKDQLEKYRDFTRTYELAEPTADQKKRGDVINTNPNVQQGIAEGLASMLRGGRGGATPSLLNIETGKRGVIQGVIDKVRTEYGGALNTLTGKDIKPYLTHLTQVQQREVLDGLKQYNDKSLDDRAIQIARRAGALGFGPDALGLGSNETSNAIGAAVEEGRQAQIARMAPHFQPIGGGDGVIQLGAQRPGSGATAAPPGTQPATQLPGAQPLATPVQQAQQPPAAAAGQPAPQPLTPQGGGAGTPVTIAGQQVSPPNLPPGASPTYTQATQRIESGNERNPWTAGAKGTSASGAFQFIDRTWNENKPVGAPARAADATPEQQKQAFETLTAKNAASLQSSGLPVNDTNLYVAHNLGAGGAASLLKAPLNADARTIVGEAAARNNPTFFKGRPTVATVLGRYQGAMAQDISDAVPRRQETLMSREAAARRGVSSAALGPTDEQRGKQWDATKQQWVDAADYAPAAASTVGALTGGALGGPPGAVVGGAVGGGAGQALKDYVQGRPQNPIEIAKQSALGGVLGVYSEARPIVAAGARVLGAGAVTAGADAAENGGSVDTLDAGVKGLAYGLGGEALGRFVSSAGATAYKVLSRYTTSAQQELSAHAGKLAEARQALATEKPTLPGDAGPNPKYEAAKVAADDATKAIKDHGQNPDDMVHAYEQAKAGVSAGEAAVMRKAQSVKDATSQGYNELRSDVAAAAGKQVPKPNQPLPDGPVAQIRTTENPRGAVIDSEENRKLAENAEMLIKAPAPNWGAKWDDLQKAGAELVKKRLSYLQNGDKPSADAMDAIFKGVRNQQKAAAEYVFGKEGGEKVISRLQELDRSWAQVSKATQGMDYGKMRSIIQAGNTPERRALEQNFKAFAGDDPSAMRAFNAMKAGAKGRMTEEAKLMVPIITAESLAHLGGAPSFGAISMAVGGHRLYKVMQEYANAKLLGRAVKFSDFLNEELRHGVAPGAAGNAAQRAVVQSQ